LLALASLVYSTKRRRAGQAKLKRGSHRRFVMSIELPSGTLSAEEIILRLAQPLADEDDFIDLQVLSTHMRREETQGTGVFPSDLRGDEAVSWLILRTRYLQHAGATGVARIVGPRLDLLPDLIDNNMLVKLLRHLTDPESQYLYSSRPSNYDRFRFYWKAKDIYLDGSFSSNNVAALREWARRQVPNWPESRS
jgi:hypothetical protein